MSIVASVIVEDSPQVDGRRHIAEKHTDHVPRDHFVRYRAAAGLDVNAVMLDRVPQVWAGLVEAEVGQNMANILSGDYTVTTDYVVVADMRQAIRAAYLEATEQEVGRIAGFLLSVSDANLKLLFGGLTNPQLNQLKGRLQDRFDELSAVLAAAGE